MQNIYITEWIKVVYDATVASSLSREQWDTAKKFKKVKEKNKIKTQQQEKVLGHSPGEPGMEFCNHGKSRDRPKLCSAFMIPNSTGFTSPIVKKREQVEITKHKQKKIIPVISRLERAVNINNRNVQVESVGWRFPHALRATWEFRASVHEPTEGASLFQICVTAFAYISILSSVLFFLFSGMIF